MRDKTPEEITQETSDWILAGLKGHERSWTVPSTAGGTDSLGDALLAVFCEGLHIKKLPPKKASQWARQLSKIASEFQATKEEAVAALGAVLDPQGDFHWMTITRPFQNGFIGAFEKCLGQAISGQLEKSQSWYEQYKDHIGR